MKKYALIAGLISLTSIASASPTFGAKQLGGLLMPGETFTSYPITLTRGEKSYITAAGDGDGDIDCVVVDEMGNIVGADNDDQDNCYIEVVPRWTGPFVVYVKNEGRISDRFNGLVR